MSYQLSGTVMLTAEGPVPPTRPACVHPNERSQFCPARVPLAGKNFKRNGPYCARAFMGQPHYHLKCPDCGRDSLVYCADPIKSLARRACDRQLRIEAEEKGTRMKAPEVKHLINRVERESNGEVRFQKLQGQEPYYEIVVFDYEFHEYRTFSDPTGWDWYRAVRDKRLNKRALGILA